MSIKILVGVILTAIVVLLVLGMTNFSKPKKSSPQPVIIFSPSPSASSFSGQKASSPTLKTVVGKTTDQEVRNLPSIESKNSLLAGQTEYKFESTPQLINHVVITQNNVVVFEKAKEVRENLQLPKASVYFTTYGQPEIEITGSKLYGNFEKTYVYASKGFAILANPFTDEVDELQIFLPMTVAEYRNIWGQDIKENQSSQEQF